MPTYEYVCKRCDERLEVFQPFSAKPLRRHESCDGELQKVFHPRGVVFKGSGFYVTDSRTKAKASSTTATSDSKAGSSSSGGTSDSGATSKATDA